MISADEFLGNTETSARKPQVDLQSAADFLEPPATSQMPITEEEMTQRAFRGGQPGEISGAGAEFAQDARWWHPAVEWITGRHIEFGPTPPEEVTYEPESGELLISEPETAAMSFFDEPTGAPLAAAIAGAALPVAAAAPLVSRVGKRAVRGVREAFAWLTGGATEVPALARLGVKTIPKAVKGVAAPRLEKTMVRAAEEPLGRAVTKPPARIAAPTPTGVVSAAERGVAAELGPESQWLRAEVEKRQLRPIKKVAEKPIIELPKKPKLTVPSAETTLRGGIPLDVMQKVWTKAVGEPVWDKLIQKHLPKALEKIPGGKAINRAFIYEYRGNLPKTGHYIKSMEEMKHHQAIGREYGVDLGRRLQTLPEKSQLRMGEFIRGEKVTLNPKELVLAKEAKQVLYDLGKQAVDLGLLSEKAFFKNAGRYMPRLYTTKEYQGLLTQYGLTKPNRLDLSRFKRRKDIPKEVREAMGEILTPGYPVAKGVSQLTHDIETARWFGGIAANREWAIVKQPKLTAAGKPSTYKRTTYHPITGKPIEHFGVRKEFVGPIPKDFKQLPANPKLGRLSEAYVHPEIHADLQETIRVMDMPEKIWRKSLGAWKFGKVILSPKTHARNLTSNSILAHLGGLPMYEQPKYLIRAAKEMRGKGKHWKAAKEEGLLRTTFTTAELGALFNRVESQLGGIKASSIPEKMGIIGEGWIKSKKGMAWAAKMYEAEEQWFKMAKYIHNVEKGGMGPAAAAKDAEKWLFNYGKLTRFQEKYRTKWYGAPFATFTFKAIPRIMEAAIKTPWRFALPGAIIYGIEQAAQRKIGDTPEEIKAKKGLRKEWMQGSFLGIPNFARVPIVDDFGREYYLNLTYTTPWGDLAEGGGFGPIPGGLMPFSMPFVKEPIQLRANYDVFWKQAIVKEEDIAGKGKVDRYKTIAIIAGKHIGQTLLPTPVMDVAKGVAALRGKPDYRGRERPTKVVMADIFLGIKMYPVDYAEQAMRRINKQDPQKGSIARKIKMQINTFYVKKQALEARGKNVTWYEKQIEKKLAQLDGLAKEAGITGGLFEETGLQPPAESYF